ncbi:putative 6-oxopurine nucleoside phosphorylase [Porphyridium purpureum]|uniref:Putative 6-oxopurine nucleoside phosphorylase n=1 Tax=Porphyridium purpureum TaxID=35688 RepID=A0A5J4Z1N6_PORPP|nr:putative 6-oxopurine nucleoside phosphorylase [Porphyridium purpureum]|eukprot:POR3989..scf208_2
MGNKKLGIIGGTSLLQSKFFAGMRKQEQDTEYGKVVVHVSESGDLVFLQRHHADAAAGAVYRPPHLINHQANMQALKDLQVDAVIAVCCVGSVTPEVTIGMIVIPDDFFNLFGGPVSMFDDGRAHIVPGMDDSLRQIMLQVLRKNEFNPVRDGGVYMQTSGPRFETPVESRFLALVGAHVVGMTAASEATLSKELDIPYAMICMVDNYANGIAREPLTREKFQANVAANQKTVERAVELLIAEFQ